MYSCQWYIGPCVQEADWQALSYTQKLIHPSLGFRPNGSFVFTFLLSLRGFCPSLPQSLCFCVLTIYCPMFRDLVRKSKHCVLKCWNSVTKFHNLTIIKIIRNCQTGVEARHLCPSQKPKAKPVDQSKCCTLKEK